MADSVIVIGAGIAGLSAADVLSGAGVAVTVLEARDRIGGRIHTLTSERGEHPIELGAEFIHGERVETWQVIREACLQTHEVPDQHWAFQQGELRKNTRFWTELDCAMAELDASAGDESFAALIRKEHLSPESKALASA